MDFATSISPRLLEQIERLAQTELPIAEINRRVGVTAGKRGVPRPSYERVRVLVNAARRLRKEPSTAAVLVDIAFRSRPPEALVDHLSGIGLPDLRT